MRQPIPSPIIHTQVEQRPHKRRNVLVIVLAFSLAIHALAWSLYSLIPQRPGEVPEQLIEVVLQKPEKAPPPLPTIAPPKIIKPQTLRKPVRVAKADLSPTPAPREKATPEPTEKAAPEPTPIPTQETPAPPPTPEPTEKPQPTPIPTIEPTPIPTRAQPKTVPLTPSATSKQTRQTSDKVPDDRRRPNQTSREETPDNSKTARRPDEQANSSSSDSRPSRPDGRSRPGRPSRPASPFSSPANSTLPSSTPNSKNDAPSRPGGRIAQRNARNDSQSPDAPDRNRNLGGASGGSTSPSRNRGANPELAGTAGGGESPRRSPRAGGGGGRNRGVLVYQDKSGRDNDRIAVSPGKGPGLNNGAGGGFDGGVGNRRGGGIGNDGDGANRGALRSRPGKGLGGDSGGAVGGGGRKKGTGETAGNGGSGGRNGRGGNGGNGNGRRGPRTTGGDWGNFGGKGDGNKNGGGDGKGPGGPGGTRIAGRPGGDGEGDGNGKGRRGRGGLPGGIGDGGKKRGTGGIGDGGSGGEGTADGGGGNRGRNRGRGNRTRTYDKEETVGRGLYPYGLKGEYFQDVDLSAKNYEAEQGRHPIDWPVFTTKKFERTDATLDFNWGVNPPTKGLDGKPDVKGVSMTGVYWSARWEGQIFVPKDDTYQFFFDALDDGGRLYLDGKRIIDVWKVQKSNPQSGQIDLKRGPHTIKVEYVQGPAVESSLSLSWKSSSFPKEVVGAYVKG